MNKKLIFIWLFLFFLIGALFSCAYAGQLLFDGVPVDITTTDNEDLLLVPGTGGNTQIGDGTGTNTYATSNDDLHITGILEADGRVYADNGLTTGSHLLPAAASSYNLGSSSVCWASLYVNNIASCSANMDISPASGYSLTSSVTKSSTGAEIAYQLSGTINKTSGNYTLLKMIATETSAPGSANKLLDMLVGSTSYFQVYNGGTSANYGVLSLGGAAWDGSTSGYFAGSSSGTQIAANAPSGFSGNLIDLQTAGSSKFSVDKSGNVTAAGTITGSSGGSAPVDATYITQTANSTLTAEQALGGLSTGIMRVATTTGVVTSLTDSSGIAANVSDETGSGALVFGTSPTFTTSMTSPLVIGGTATTSDLNLQTTSGVGTTGADMHFLVGSNGATEAMTILNSGSVGIGTTAPAALLDLTSPATSGGIPTLALTPGAHTAMTAEKSDFSIAAHTDTITGAITTQRFSVFGTPTISAASSLTVTNADTVNIAGLPTAASSATISGASALRIPVAPQGSANVGLVSLASGAWDGSTSGFFAGSSSGTVLAVNAASGYVGNLADWQVAGSSKFKVDSSGNLTVAGTQTFTGNTTVSGNLAVNGNTTLGDASTDTVTLNAAAVTVANDTNFVLSGGVNGASFNTNTLSIDATNGRVGIGTTAPSDFIHISQNPSSTNTVTNDLRLERLTTGTAANGLGVATDYYLEDDGGNSNEAARIDVVWEDATNTSEDASIRFNQMVAGTLTEKMRIDDAGSVGIGTTAPAALLDLTSPATSGGIPTLALTPGAHTAMTAEKSDFSIAAHTDTITGAITTQRFSVFGTPTISAASSLTVTNADTVNIAGLPTAASSATISGASALRIPVAPQGSANVGLVSLASGAWDGSTSGFFAGSSSGTVLAVNAASGYVGNLADWQVAGSSKFKVDSSGNLTVAGTQTFTGNTTVSGNLAVNGNTTLGDASTDTVTLNAAAVTVANDTNFVLSGGVNGASFNTNTLSIDATNGRVGIGTTAPGALLDVGLAGTTLGVIRLEGSTSGYAALQPTAAAGSVTLTLPAATDTLVGKATTDTLTNKRVTRRAVTVTQHATPTINTDNTDVAHITGLAQAISSMTTNLSGTPVEGDMLRIDITDDGTARAITWGASFEASGTVALPTTTVVNVRLDVGFIWNTVTSKWRCVASA